VDTFKKNQEQIEELVKMIYDKLGYVDYNTIREILLIGMQYDQSLAIGYIGKPHDALNYLKESNNIIEYLVERIEE
jgi:uncharacterized protein (UPF0297 family)